VKHLHVSHRSQLIGGVSMSIGVACFPDHGAGRETLLQAADAALYAAKNSGRDRVIVSVPPAAPPAALPAALPAASGGRDLGRGLGPDDHDVPAAARAE